MLDKLLHHMRIGGSQVAAILGLDQFEDPFTIWAKMMGELPNDLPEAPDAAYDPAAGIEIDRRVMGKIFEPAILELYRYATHRECIFWDKTLEGPWPFMVLTPDVICPNLRVGVDLKLVHFDQSFLWGRTVAEIPDRVVLQAVWYMAGLNYDNWDIAALIADKLRIYTIERDLELEDRVLKAVERWWKRYIIGGERPPITGSAGAARWLQRKFPRDRRPDLVEPTEEQWKLYAEYCEVREQQEPLWALQKRRDLLENQLKLSLGEHEGLKLFGGDKFTWKRSKDTEETNWENVARGLLNEYVKDEDLAKTLIGLHTAPKEGSRRIYFRRGKQQSVEDAA